MSEREIRKAELRIVVPTLLVAATTLSLAIAIYVFQTGIAHFLIVMIFFIAIVLRLCTINASRNRAICQVHLRELEKVNEKASRDFLTGFYNRGTTQMMIDSYLRLRAPAALMVIDIDNFKMVNDRLGHISGDCVLRDISTDIRTIFRESDIVGRVGGDEFVILLAGTADREQVFKKAEQLLEICTRNVCAENGLCGISCSIGIAFAPDCGDSYDKLFECADRALYRSKNEGKCRISFFS